MLDPAPDELAEQSFGVNRRSAALEGAGLALFGEGAGGFLEVLRQVQLQWRGLHRHFALELVHIPATGADRRANRERRVPADGTSCVRREARSSEATKIIIV